MKTLKQRLREAKLQFRPVDEDEIAWGRKFQEVMAISIDFQKAMEKNGSDPFYLFDQLKKHMQPYFQEPWMRRFHEWVDYRQEDVDQYNASKAHVEKHKDRHEEIFKSGKAVLGDPVALRAWYKKLGDHKKHLDIVSKGDSHAFPRGRGIAKRYVNPFFKENGLFFGTTGFLSQFVEGEMEDIIKTDLTKAYTALPYPTQSEDFEHVAYWFMKLKTNDDEWDVPHHDLKKVTKMQNMNNPDLDRLYELVASYLKSNDKSALKKAMALLPSFDNFFAKNEQSKNSISVVYRGLVDRYDPDNEEDVKYNSKMVIEEDIRRGTVATSRHRSVAERFVYTSGAHLIQREVSDSGWLISYEVGPDSIILDTTIFGGVFGEAEIVIDPSRATGYEVEYLYGEDHDWYPPPPDELERIRREQGMMAMIKAPMTVPMMVPEPPNSEAPPITTAGTGPISEAITPARNSPSSLEAPMNTMLTALTRPRSSSGVHNCTRLWRT